MDEAYVTFLTDILYAVAIGALGYLAAYLAGRLLRRVLPRFLRDSWVGFLANLASLGIILLTIKIVVDQTGWAGAFVVVVTAITGAFAIGSERLAADLVAGLKLLFLNYYEVGQLVTISGKVGFVEKISLSQTILRTRQRDVVTIPNSTAINQIVVNHSQIPGHIVIADVPIAGKHDREKVMDLMSSAAADFPLLMEGNEPVILLAKFGPQTSFYKVGVMVDEDDWKPVTEYRLLYQITSQLEAEGIEVGIPALPHLAGE